MFWRRKEVGWRRAEVEDCREIELWYTQETVEKLSHPTENTDKVLVCDTARESWA